MTKAKIIEAIVAMPENRFDENETQLERLFLLDKIEQGEEDVKGGRVHTNEEMKEIIKSWFTSPGQTPQPTTCRIC
jgi:predicted transcriptional regulator